MPLNRKDKIYKVICPSCKKDRLVTYCQDWNIKRGNNSGKCNSCKEGRNIVGLKKGHGWNRGIKGKKSHSFGVVGYWKGKTSAFKNKRHSEETKNKMRLAKLGKVGLNLGKKWKISKEKLKGRIFPKGENHPRWIKDRSKIIPKQERNDYAYKDWRRKVWLRDNFTCKIANPSCKGRLEAHHILGWTAFPELRYELNNGITLCHAHHPRKREDEAKLSPYFQKLVAEIK